MCVLTFECQRCELHLGPKLCYIGSKGLQLVRAPYRRTEPPPHTHSREQWVTGELDYRLRCAYLWLNFISLQDPKDGLGRDHWISISLCNEATLNKPPFSSVSKTLSCWIWSRISLWFWVCPVHQLLPLDSFSGAHPPPVCFLRRNVYSDPPFTLNCLVLLFQNYATTVV